MKLTLCGSTKFKEEYLKAFGILMQAGHVVATCECFPHSDGITLTAQQGAQLDDLHKKKVEWADAIVIIDPEGYVGDSTKNEIAFARGLGRDVYWWPLNRDELIALAVDVPVVGS